MLYTVASRAVELTTAVCDDLIVNAWVRVDERLGRDEK
jgi:hypothetical protein